MEQEFPPSDNAGHGSRSGHLGALSGEAGGTGREKDV